MAEAKKLGFETCILPEVSLKMVKGIKGIKLAGVKNIGTRCGKSEHVKRPEDAPDQKKG